MDEFGTEKNKPDGRRAGKNFRNEKSNRIVIQFNSIQFVSFRNLTITIMIQIYG